MGKIQLPPAPDLSEAAKDMTPATQKGINNQQQANEQAKPKKLLQVQIDKELHADFKGRVGKLESNMTDVVEKMIRDYLRETASLV